MNYQDKQIIVYNIVGGFNSDELVANVEEAIREGWQVLGQPFLIRQSFYEYQGQTNYHNEIVQAVIKYKEVSDAE